MAQLLWYQNIGIPEPYKPFVNVEHDVCVIIAKREQEQMLLCSITVFDPKKRGFVNSQWNATKDDMIIEEFDNAFNLMLRSEDLAILRKIRRFPQIEEFLQCHEGIHTGNAREVLFKRKQENKSCKPLFYGGGTGGDEISNYVSRRNGWFVDYRKELIDKNKGLYASLRDPRIFEFPKIYITRTGNPFKAFLDETTYASNNFFSLQFEDYKENSLDALKVILPFIVSSLAQYFVRNFAAPRLGNTFVETKIIHLLKFRIPKLSQSTQDDLKLVDRILAAKKRDPKADTTALEREIDALVYQLYGLTAEEIKVVENSGSR